MFTENQREWIKTIFCSPGHTVPRSIGNVVMHAPPLEIPDKAEWPIPTVTQEHDIAWLTRPHDDHAPVRAVVDWVRAMLAWGYLPSDFDAEMLVRFVIEHGGKYVELTENGETLARRTGQQAERERQEQQAQRRRNRECEYIVERYLVPNMPAGHFIINLALRGGGSVLDSPEECVRYAVENGITLSTEGLQLGREMGLPGLGFPTHSTPAAVPAGAAQPDTTGAAKRTLTDELGVTAAVPSEKKKAGRKADPEQQKRDMRIHQARKTGASIDELALGYNCTRADILAAIDRGRKRAGRMNG